MTRLTLALALAPIVGACGEETCPKIDGSLSVSYDVDFEDVRIRRFSEEVSVEYVRNAGTPAEEIALKIALSFTDNDIRVDQTIPLTRESVDRSTTDGATFPDLCTDRPSNITFSSYGENEGDTIEGEWRLCFDTGLDAVGCFDGDLQVIE